MFDLDAYLDRIRLTARPGADEAGLAVLQRAHRLAIPFENLDVRLGRGIAIDSASVFAKLVGARRGGYCFEQNRLFLDALAALGFVARPLLARVWLAGGDAVPPLTHALSLVSFSERVWIADAGFGGSYAPPMPLVDGTEVAAPDGARFRLAREGIGWMLYRHGTPAATDGRGDGEGWQRQYGFLTTEVMESDLHLSNHWTSTAPGTRFTTLAIASVVLPDGFASITDRAWRCHTGGHVGGRTDAIEITDPDGYRALLGQAFGITLTAREVAALDVFAAGD